MPGPTLRRKLPLAEGDAASKADAASRAVAEDRLEALGRQIEGRARLHEADMKALEVEIQAVASKIRPHEAELQALGREMEKAAPASPRR